MENTICFRDLLEVSLRQTLEGNAMPDRIANFEAGIKMFAHLMWLLFIYIGYWFWFLYFWWKKLLAVRITPTSPHNPESTIICFVRFCVPHSLCAYYNKQGLEDNRIPSKQKRNIFNLFAFGVLQRWLALLFDVIRWWRDVQ